MKLEVDFPRISPAIDGGTVVAWHKTVGDRVEYGDPLCDVAVEEVKRMKRSMRARLGRPAKAKFRTLDDIHVRYRITSMDSGVLSNIATAVGEAATVGTVIAIIDTEDGHTEKSAKARSSCAVLRPESELAR